ncbi:anhydro-N-acetylmuramic acid kinase [Phytomonospora endophytica]|uniref:Anhydro-N-acetylmuramic acid kinase n=1 Tax=Phytomonospora endophytica TaxID=714109 RepID=A0A841FNW3_9ACTN|nr:anhydro-N-acetylmuramic acid kinase [Phytomonospora endophytica]MBB6034917.1 anhydro-N-acetylmuramic acid kinase [Phytomonospora endophytica]GIG70621.1 anhydro-N-acetylmuramic acid kinase [Phytomonospora endophytica]
MRIIGIMSGTSHDAIDVAAADFSYTDGILRLTPLGDLAVEHDPRLRAAVVAVLPPAKTTIGDVCELDTRLGRAFGAAAARGLAELCEGHADLVVSHGQTVFHWIEGTRAHGTLQLGQPAWIAAATGLPVLSDLRAADIAAGGQGAPLVPVLDAGLLAPGQAALNIGGIANLTAVAADGAVTAYDIGPGNALIDAAARVHFGLAYDKGGALAVRGTVDEALLARLLAEPYYRLPAPKSTGKELFHGGYLDDLGWTGDPHDLLATLTELTAATIADAVAAHGSRIVYASGGGVHNPLLRARIWARGEGRFELRETGDLGIPVDAKEAYAFALLGWLSAHGLPGALPEATGASRAAVLGSLTAGVQPLRLPEPLGEWSGRIVVG